MKLNENEINTDNNENVNYDEIAVDENFVLNTNYEEIADKKSWRQKNAEKLKPFKNMTKKEKASRLSCIIFELTIALFCLIRFLIITITKVDPGNRQFSYFSTACLFLAPIAIEFLFKVRLGDFMEIFFLVFAFFASFIGSALGGYKKLNFMNYDKIVHAIFGVVGCIVGLYLMCKFSNFKDHSVFFICMFCFIFSMACGAMWEIFEYTSDNFFGQSAQGNADDTMLDIISNFFGAVFFVIYYIIHKVSKKNLLIDSMEKEFLKK